MSLIKCRECGKQISEYADVCPYCGEANSSKRALNDIEINGNYETKYFTYAKRKLDADIASQKAAEEARKADLKAEEEALKTQKAAEAKRKFRNRCLILVLILWAAAIVIGIFGYRVLRNRSTQRAWKEQIQADEDVIAVIENAMLGEVENGKLLVTEQMAYYVENGVTLFGDISGELRVQIEPVNEEVLWYISFESDEISRDQRDMVLDECIEIYGDNYRNSPYNDYIWEQDTYDHVTFEYKLIHYNVYTISVTWHNEI